MTAERYLLPYGHPEAGIEEEEPWGRCTTSVVVELYDWNRKRYEHERECEFPLAKCDRCDKISCPACANWPDDETCGSCAS